MRNWGGGCEAKRITRKLAIPAPVGRMTKPGGQAIRENEQGLRARDLPRSEPITCTTNKGKAGGDNQMGVEIKPMLYPIEQIL